ncbi:MAG: hypothetical protein K9J27_05040 [Bacteroidales bacterium]|nr:hypothetical protein [Bacteroidales bacterium]MCF8333071.1 hypothetical protein [Bacteroidales bacterium]
MQRWLIIIAGNSDTFSLNAEAIESQDGYVFLIRTVPTLYKLPKLKGSLYAVVIDGDLFKDFINEDYVKHIRQVANKPLLILTSGFKIDQLKQAVKLGFDEYLAKPINSQQLIELIKKHNYKFNQNKEKS